MIKQLKTIFSLVSILFLVIPVSYSQTTEKQKLRQPIAQEATEITEDRTEFSRKFKLKGGGITTAISSTPLHYMDAQGNWQPIVYMLGVDEQGMTIFPLNVPTYKMKNDAPNLTHILPDGKFLYSSEHPTVKTILKNGNVLKESPLPSNCRAEYSKNTRAFSFEQLKIEQHFHETYLKTNYIILNKPDFVEDGKWFVVEEQINLPEGWVLESLSGKRVFDFLETLEGFVIRKSGSEARIIYSPPVSTDNGLNCDPKIKNIDSERIHTGNITPEYRHLHSVACNYQIQHLGHGKFKIGIAVSYPWLMEEHRIFPVTIDPVVINQSTATINSCFAPSYDSGTLSTAVPVGDTIINTYLEWDFNAVGSSGAWTEDQRSYVSGPNGSTPVFAGQGQAGGMDTYQTNTTIANGISTGNVDFTFHASRVWGGSGCNGTYNFISRTYVEITHFEELIIGTGLVVVNEYSCSNRQMTDNFGDFEDWIELHNTSSNFVSLAGYYLSDNPNNPTKWQFPGGLIAPGGYFLVFCSGKDTLMGNSAHTNFRLSQLKNERIIFSDPSGQELENHPLFITQNGHSFGRLQDAGPDWGIFENPTASQANTGGKTGYTPKPQFSLQAGFYTGNISVSMTGNGANEEIRFTTNGNEPTPSSSLYTGPINISNTTVLRARIFSTNPDKLPGFMETNTYFINEQSTLPVFSFSGNQLPTLFNGTQIKPMGAVEYFDVGGAFVDESYCQFDKHGNDSWSYPQRGVDFVSRDQYGYNAAMTYPFFRTSDRTEFQRLMVKAAANDNFPFQTGGAHIRDSYVQTLSQLTKLDLDERSSTNCLVFVNGQYWGVYDLRERVDDVDYTEYYYNQERKYRGSEEYVQFLKTWGSTVASFGEQRALDDWQTLRNFIQNNNMGQPANIATVEAALNIESLLDYFVLNSFVVARDWLNYNTGWWRGLNPNGDARGWRYIVWDLEAALGHFHNYTGLPNTSATAPLCQVENLSVGHGHVQILNKLINDNPSIRQKYVTRYADLLNTGLSCNNILHVFDSMIAVIAPEMPRQIARWGGSMADWQNNVNTLRTFLSNRCSFALQSMNTCYNLTGPFPVTFNISPAGAGQVKMNSVWLNQFPFQANIYGNISTNLEAEGIGPYVFSHWEIFNHTLSPGTAHPLVSNTFIQGDSVVAHFINPWITQGELLYYWHFNNLSTPTQVTEIDADFKLLPNTNPKMTFAGNGNNNMDVFNTGSGLNLHMGEGAGKAARVRNPSANRHLVFNLPTTGYHNISFRYVVHRSAQGMLENIISYSVDGVNYIQTGLLNHTFSITEEYQVVDIDFSHIALVNNNPNFHIRIDFNGNTSQSNGNNRYDNITLFGETFSVDVPTEDSKPGLTVFPNPSNEAFRITSQKPIKQIRIFDSQGRLIQELSQTNYRETTINASNWSQGVYLLHVTDVDDEHQVRFLLKQ